MQHINRELVVKLHNAIKEGKEKEVISLLEQDVSPSVLLNGTTALHLAVQSENEKLLGWLLDKTDSISQLVSYRTVMNLAAHNCRWRSVVMIAKKKQTDASDNGQYGSALIDAIRFCKDDVVLREIIEALLAAGAIDNCTTQSNGYTSLHWAVERDKPYVLKMLMAKFPQHYLRKGSVSISPARLAFQLEHWNCLSAIGEVAYLSLIKNEITDYPDDFKNEKDIIFKYVMTLSPELKWQAILNGQNKKCALGHLNHAHKDSRFAFIEPKTVSLYAEEEKAMRKQGYPQCLAKSKPIAIQRAPSVVAKKLVATSPGWKVEDYLDGGAERKQQEYAMRKKLAGGVQAFATFFPSHVEEELSASKSSSASPELEYSNS